VSAGRELGKGKIPGMKKTSHGKYSQDDIAVVLEFGRLSVKRMV